MVKALRVFFFTLNEEKASALVDTLKKLGFKVVRSQVVPGFYFAETDKLELREEVAKLISTCEDWKITEVVV